MELFYGDYWYITIVVGMVAGLIDSIAGGGGLITIPALIFMGLSPVSALATNKLQACFGTLSSSVKFYSNGIVSLKLILPAIILAFLSSAFGAFLIQLLNDRLLLVIVPILLVIFAIYFFLFSSKISAIDSKNRFGSILFGFTAGIGIGFYDGFFGPGTGSFFCLALILLHGYNLIKGVAHAKVLNLASNFGALLIFIWADNVIWLIGLLMGVGQLMGAWFGSHAVLKNGINLVRPLLIVVLISFFVKLIYTLAAHNI